MFSDCTWPPVTRISESKTEVDKTSVSTKMKPAYLGTPTTPATLRMTMATEASDSLVFKTALNQLSFDFQGGSTLFNKCKETWVEDTQLKGRVLVSPLHH